VRHLFFLLALVALVAGGYFLLRPSDAAIDGRVFLSGLDGREIAGAGAKVKCYPADVVDAALADWLRKMEELRSENGLELQAARSEWSRAVTRREEAARLLSLAEQSRSADLAISQARYREAAADAEEALRRMERLDASLDEEADPGRFVSALEGASGQVAAGPDGSFRMAIPSGVEVYLAVVLAGEQGGNTSAWLRRGAFSEGEEVLFSNANLLTARDLAEMSRRIKKPESRDGPPAE